MARRMSNRNRIDRMREEADATQAEKGKAPAETGRMAAVWAVKDGHGEVVAVYPYARKTAAEAEAERLKTENRKAYIVCPHKVPF